MSLRIAKECWDHWHATIAILAASYGFPATSLSELRSLLRLHIGGGSTYRITGQKGHRFVLDVTRQNNSIVDIIAITMIARLSLDGRRHGAVITKACNVHPTPSNEKRPGAPHLRWYPVTSGGEIYQHCCDKECTSPDRSGPASRGTWETTRLRIVQKAYEQDTIVMRKRCKEATAKASSNPQALLQAQPTNAEVALSKKDNAGLVNGAQLLGNINHLSRGQSQKLSRQLRDEVESLRHDLHAANIEAEALRARNVQLDKDNAEKSATIENLRQEVTHVQGQKANIRLENNDQVARIREQRHLISNLLKKNKKLEDDIQDSSTQNTELDNISKKLESENQVLSEHNEKLISRHNTLLESRQSLRDSNAELEAKVEKMDRKKKRMDNKLSDLVDKTRSQEKHIEALMAANDEVIEVNAELNETTTKLEKEKEEAIKASEGYVEQLTELDNELQQSRVEVTELWHDMEVKNERDRRTEAALAEAQQSLKQKSAAHSDQTKKLKKDMSAKDTFIQRLQGDILCLQEQSQAALHTSRRGRGARDEAPASVHELQHQREISRQANEKASDMESKLEAMKLAMEAMKSELQTEKAELNVYKAETDAKKAEVEALAKKCAERMNAANAKESYTMSLEKQLEEMRGNLEGMLGRVSVYQGKKRRRTEGPDFQL